MLASVIKNIRKRDGTAVEIYNRSSDRTRRGPEEAIAIMHATDILIRSDDDFLKAVLVEEENYGQ